MRIGSLCTGYGGLEMAVRSVLGGEVAWHSEHDPDPQHKDAAARFLAWRYPEVSNLGDLRMVDWSNIEPVDVLCAGFPCQPASTAGRRRGMNDRRWLWDDIADVIAVLRPELIVLENVPGLLAGSSEVADALCLCGWADRRRGMFVDYQNQQEFYGDSPDPDVEKSRWPVGPAASDVRRQSPPLSSWAGELCAGYPMAAVQGTRRAGVPRVDPSSSGPKGRGGAPPVELPPAPMLDSSERSRPLDPRVSGTRGDDVEAVPRIEREGSGHFDARSGWSHCPVCGWEIGQPPNQPVRRSWMGAVLRSLAALGYVGSWRTVRASDVGACHRRERIVIIAAHAESPGLEGRWQGRAGGVAAAHADGHPLREQPVAEPGSGRASLAGGDRERPTAHAESERWGQGRAEPAGQLGGPDAAERGDGPAADTECCGRDGRAPQPVGDEVRGAAAAGARAVGWGRYAVAVARHERALGRAAPPPTVPRGRGGAERLSPAFVEWMMMLDEGHVTGCPDLTANQMLHVLGNGVVPPAIALAVADLTRDLAAGAT